MPDADEIRVSATFSTYRMRFIAEQLVASEPKSGDISEAACLLVEAAALLDRQAVFNQQTALTPAEKEDLRRRSQAIIESLQRRC